VKREELIRLARPSAKYGIDYAEALAQLTAHPVAWRCVGSLI
jgi:hypothetical protein